jgi:SH3-like domain-containing protein
MLRKALAIGLSFVLALPAISIATVTPAAAQARQVCLRDGSLSRLRMRAYPAEENVPIVGYALHGEPVLVVDSVGSFWLIVDSVGNRGWVPKRFICRF